MNPMFGGFGMQNLAGLQQWIGQQQLLKQAYEQELYRNHQNAMNGSQIQSSASQIKQEPEPNTLLLLED